MTGWESLAVLLLCAVAAVLIALAALIHCSYKVSSEEFIVIVYGEEDEVLDDEPDFPNSISPEGSREQS